MNVINGKIDGLFGEFLLELSSTINFTINLLTNDTIFRNTEERNNTFAGILGMIVDGSSDLIVAEMNLDISKAKIMTLTTPIIISSYALYFRAGVTTTIPWTDYFQVSIKKYLNNFFFFSVFPCFKILIKICRHLHLMFG